MPVALAKPVRQRTLSLREDKDYLHSVICDGAAKAQVHADAMLAKVYHTVGLLERK